MLRRRRHKPSRRVDPAVFARQPGLQERIQQAQQASVQYDTTAVTTQARRTVTRDKYMRMFKQIPGKHAFIGHEFDDPLSTALSPFCSEEY
jgi:stress response protein SCP2